MPEEYYIRQPDSENAKGPYSVDKLVTLAEAGQVTRETLYYDDELESWAAVGSNEELKQQVFPERRRLSLRKKSSEEISLLTGEDEDDEVVSVQDILAAAEGKTEDTRHLSANLDWRKRIAGWSTNIIGICLLATAAFLILSHLDFFQGVYRYYMEFAGFSTPEQGADPAVMPQFSVAVLLAMIDVLFALLALAGMTTIYPLLRVRCMFFLGYFGLYYWGRMLLDDPHAQALIWATIGSSVGIYVATLTTRMRIFLPAAGVAILGTGYFAYLQIAQILAERAEESEKATTLLGHWFSALS
ncbi:MAG: hypothetical protein E1N59_478 [Puniceicoccaceae bacterium 5H]|nr:MAG: hypothetical protein E1N59_478 [Puniceicoccaceae bacterium 5H]